MKDTSSYNSKRRFMKIWLYKRKWKIVLLNHKYLKIVIDWLQIQPEKENRILQRRIVSLIYKGNWFRNSKIKNVLLNRKLMSKLKLLFGKGHLEMHLKGTLKGSIAKEILLMIMKIWWEQ